jgi:hypothetical protein
LIDLKLSKMTLRDHLRDLSPKDQHLLKCCWRRFLLVRRCTCMFCVLSDLSMTLSYIVCNQLACCLFAYFMINTYSKTVEKRKMFLTKGAYSKWSWPLKWPMSGKYFHNHSMAMSEKHWVTNVWKTFSQS